MPLKMTHLPAWARASEGKMIEIVVVLFPIPCLFVR